MIIYLTISLITFFWLSICFCRITYLWVRHKRESKREVALADELIEEENGIIVTGSTTTAQTIETIYRWNYNGDYFIPLREEKKNFLPKKKIKSHKLVERKFTLTYRPGAYTREVDLSIYDDFFRDRRRYNE